MRAGLWIPPEIRDRYNFEEQPVAAALLKHYWVTMGNRGLRVELPLVQLLATLRVTSLEVEDVEDILNTIRSQGTTDYHYRGAPGCLGRWWSTSSPRWPRRSSLTGTTWASTGSKHLTPLRKQRGRTNGGKRWDTKRVAETVGVQPMARARMLARNVTKS